MVPLVNLCMEYTLFVLLRLCKIRQGLRITGIRSRVTNYNCSLRSNSSKCSRPVKSNIELLFTAVPRGPRLRLSNPCIPSNGKGRKCVYTCGLPIAGIQGFEPQLTVPETVVLPLDDIPIFCFVFPSYYEHITFWHRISFSEEVNPMDSETYSRYTP